MIATLILASLGIGATNLTSGLMAAPAVAINWTAIITVLTICLSAMATFIKIFSGRVDSDSLPGEQNPFCKLHIEQMKEIINANKENSSRQEKIKEIVSQMDKELASALKDNENLNKSVDEIKKDYRELAGRLDNLLRQLIDWMSD